MNFSRRSILFVAPSIGFFLTGCATTDNAPVLEAKALIIGNNYQGSQLELANPVNDAMLISNTVENLGHPHQLLLNSDFARFDEAMNNFTAELDQGTTAILYYSGHGVQWRGQNYIIFEDEKAVSVENIVTALKSKGGNVIIILDACRSQPETWRSDEATKSVQISPLKTGKGISRTENDQPLDLSRMVMGDVKNDGLAEMRLEQDGLFIAFATAPNGVAYDHPLEEGAVSDNSPFAQSLAESLLMPIEFGEALNRTSDRVIGLTQRQQIPWRQTSMRDSVYLAGRPSLTNSGTSKGPSMPPL